MSTSRRTLGRASLVAGAEPPLDAAPVRPGGKRRVLSEGVPVRGVAPEIGALSGARSEFGGGRPVVVSVTRAAELCGLPIRTFSRHLADAPGARVRRGVDLGKLLPRLIRPDDDGVTAARRAAERDWMQARAERERLRLEAQRGAVIPRSEHLAIRVADARFFMACIDNLVAEAQQWGGLSVTGIQNAIREWWSVRYDELTAATAEKRGEQ